MIVMSSLRTSGPPLLWLTQCDAVLGSYPDSHAGRRKAVISMADLQWGHLKNGLGRSGVVSIMTRKISCTRDSSRLALPCKKS